MVELEEPYCGDISCWSTCFRESGYVIKLKSNLFFKIFYKMITFSNIETENIKEVKPKFYEVLDDVLKTGVDMKRMKSILNREREKVYFFLNLLLIFFLIVFE